MAVYLPNQRPHVSAAVKQLRGWVTLCVTLLAFSAAMQMLVFAFVQYTDVRYVDVRQVTTEAPLRVVTPGAPTDASSNDASQVVAGGMRATLPESTTKTVRTLSGVDNWLERASTLACAVGVLSACMLAILTFMGVLVAGGACVPGVERVVSSAVWSLVLAILCMPWSTLAPHVGVPGVFVGYTFMTIAVDQQVAAGRVFGSISCLAQWVGAPAVAMFTSLGICLWFRSGVERGVIATSPSEFDKAIEREVEHINRSGATSSAPKAVGALNRAIGEEARPHHSPHASHHSHPHHSAHPPTNAVERALDHAAAQASSLVHESATATSPKRVRTVADADYKRPI